MFPTPEISELSAIAAEHALQLNAASGFQEKWNSDSGRFFSTLLTQDSSISAAGLSEALYQLGLHSHDSGFNFSMAAHLCAGVLPIVKHERSGRFRDAINEGAICANAMTETESGSDSFHMRTRATNPGNRMWSITGSKTFVTNGPVADLVIVYALSDADKGFFGGITAFILEKKKHSFTIGTSIEKSGLKTSPMCELHFDGCPVSEEYSLGEGAGAMIFLESMDWERACIAAMHAGTMKRLCEVTARYANTRMRREQKLAALQGVQFRIADLAVHAETSRLMAQKAAYAVDRKNGSVAAAQAKIIASEALMQAAGLAATIHGANGITTGYGFADLLADAQAAQIYSGPNDVLRELIASRL